MAAAGAVVSTLTSLLVSVVVKLSLAGLEVSAGEDGLVVFDRAGFRLPMINIVEFFGVSVTLGGVGDTVSSMGGWLLCADVVRFADVPLVSSCVADVDASSTLTMRVDT